MSQEYIDAFYGHQSAFVQAKHENNHALCRQIAKHLFLYKQEISKENDNNEIIIEFVNVDSVIPNLKKPFYGLRLSMIIKRNGVILYPKKNPKLLHKTFVQYHQA
ncbi:hypothetical protein [Vibrio campbellii]|uniref:hypothetical protein n=1 Tax=Vibrio campbellii TaxID=680 RepID=UPI000CD36CFC|nr:hypothetical protein [Vibrio campbellii]AUV88517.1 hypothetical protein C1N50_20415 [Vibrio campbellii]